MSETRVFRHVVGKSTLREGVTVHRDFEAWFDSPEVSDKTEIALTYDGDKEAIVTLRRLNNTSKHVQIRYSPNKHAPLIDWLNQVFVASKDRAVGEILEFHKISKDRYSLKPVTLPEISGAKLCISRTLYHGGARHIIPYVPVFAEVSQVIGSVDFQPWKNQARYNQELRQGFGGKGWSADRPVAGDLNLKDVLMNANVQIEVEFGNARAYYQDYLKFSIAFGEGDIALGALVTPTADFAGILCEIGREKAWQQAKGRGEEARPTYSGMMTYEKAV